MKTFTYLDISSDNILEDKLALVQFDTLDMLPSTTREVLKSETNVYRPANYYGVKYQELELPIGICKENGQAFTMRDREIVEDLIFGSDIPSDLTIIDSNGNQSIFNGLFTSIEWRCVGRFIIGADLIFESTSPFWFKSTIDSETIVGEGTWNTYCNSKVGYTYPNLTIKNNTTEQEVKIVNQTDNNNEFTAKIGDNETVSFNCEYCKVMSNNTYEELGWEDKSNLYWLRFTNGYNQLKITGDVDITISYKSKKRGLGSYFGDYFNGNEPTNTIARINGEDLLISGLYKIEGENIIVYGTTLEGENIIFNN